MYYLTAFIAAAALAYAISVILEWKVSLKPITTKQVVRFVVALIVLIATFYYKFFIADF